MVFPRETGPYLSRLKRIVSPIMRFSVASSLPLSLSLAPPSAPPPLSLSLITRVRVPTYLEDMDYVMVLTTHFCPRSYARTWVMFLERWENDRWRRLFKASRLYVGRACITGRGWSAKAVVVCCQIVREYSNERSSSPAVASCSLRIILDSRGPPPINISHSDYSPLYPFSCVTLTS